MSPLPDLGELDPAPAMALALGEASYVVRSYGTPQIAWFLGPEVYGSSPGGDWVEVAEACNEDYERFSRTTTRTTTRHQNEVHKALKEGS